MPLASFGRPSDPGAHLVVLDSDCTRSLVSRHHTALAVLERDKGAVAVTVEFEIPFLFWLKVSEVGEWGEEERGRGKEGREVVAVVAGLSRESLARETKGEGIEEDVTFPARLRSYDNHTEIATMVMLASYESSLRFFLLWK